MLNIFAWKSGVTHPTLARGHVTGEAGRLRVARHAIAPAPDRFANAVSRVPSPAGAGAGTF